MSRKQLKEEILKHTGKHLPPNMIEALYLFSNSLYTNKKQSRDTRKINYHI